MEVVKEMDKKEKPIIFSTEMVKAILDGRKTQTRRIIRYGDKKGMIRKYCGDDSYIFAKNYPPLSLETNSIEVIKKYLPYKKGDILWVRETWNDTWGDDVLYKANGGSAKDLGYKKVPKWKPSIYMPRKYARIFLKVKNVRVEQIQDISVKDIREEGMNSYDREKSLQSFTGSRYAKDWFVFLWDSINKKRGFGWDVNPWVWVIEFERIDNG